MNVVNAALSSGPQDNLTKTDPFRVERMDKNDGLIMIDGNTAARAGRDLRRRELCRRGIPSPRPPAWPTR